MIAKFGLLTLASMALLGMARAASADEKADGVLGFTAKDIDGHEVPLSKFRGKVLLIVNTASKCGYTPQYEGLEDLYEKYKDRGLVVLAFPANEFGKQEPGSDAEIKEFCTTKFHTNFPLFSKIVVKGQGQHPLYRHLTKDDAEPITWNFNKFLVGRDGQVLARFDSKVKPESQELTEAVEKALAAK